MQDGYQAYENIIKNTRIFTFIVIIAFKKQ